MIGPVADSFPAERMLLLLQRSPERESALQRFLQEAHRPGSPNYHHWLTPEQFAGDDGPADSEIAAVRGWLERQGFSVERVTRGRTAIEFSGTAGQVRSAFHTEIHSYAVQGKKHYANNLDPQVPAALAPVIAGISPINDFRPTPYVKFSAKLSMTALPESLFRSGLFLNITICSICSRRFRSAVRFESAVRSGSHRQRRHHRPYWRIQRDPTVVATYRSFFGLPASPLNVVIDGLDPGENGAFVESYLDVEEAGAVAPGATITLYTPAGPRCKTVCILRRASRGRRCA